MENEIITVEAKQEIEQSQSLAKQYESYAITTADKYVDSANDLKIVKAKAKELDTLRKSLTQPLEDSKKRIIALFKVPLDYLEQAESSIKKAMVNWQAEQERIRREEEQRLAEIQRKEAEKLRLQAEKEVARIASLKTEQGKTNAQARADELKAQAEFVAAVAPIVKSKVEDVKGISTRKIWKFKIVDVNKIPREYMIPDEVYIGKIVKASAGNKQIEGIEIYSENTIASRF